jgi:hypothetical protein
MVKRGRHRGVVRWSDERDQSVVEELELDFARAGRILVPGLIDWIMTVSVLRRLAGKYDYEQIGCGRLTNKALIVVSPGRTGITVLTASPRDCGKLSEFHSFQWHVAGLCPLRAMLD